MPGSLAQLPRPGVGEALVRHLIEHYMGRGLAYLDLSVLHDNQQAKALYAKLGFRDLQTFTVKRKNSFNQPLFLGPGRKPSSTPTPRSSSTKPAGAASRSRSTMPRPDCSRSPKVVGGCVAGSRCPISPRP